MGGHTRLGLRVLGGFQLLVDGRPIAMPVQAQRLLALLSVRPHQSRSAVAGTLWGESTEARAQANLRNAVWLIRRTGEPVLSCSRQSVELSAAVSVDLARAQQYAQDLLAVSPGSRVTVDARLIDVLGHDLLPAWDEDWLVIDRERQRQLRLHALEVLSGTLSRSGRFPEAISAALAAVHAEPLRESAQRALVQAHVDEGNVSEGIRQLDAYTSLLREQLGIAPSELLVSIICRAVRTQRIAG